MSYGNAASLKTAVEKLINDSVIGVDTTAKVYKLQRQLADDDAAKLILVDVNNKVNAWFMSISKMDDTMRSQGQSGVNARGYTIEVVHYATIDDISATPSEATVEERTEKFMDGVNKNLRPLLPAGSHIKDFPAATLGYALFNTLGGILVHKVGIIFSVDLWDSRA